MVFDMSGQGAPETLLGLHGEASKDLTVAEELCSQCWVPQAVVDGGVNW